MVDQYIGKHKDIYHKSSDKFCMQGGYLTNVRTSSSAGTFTLALLKEYKDTDYQFNRSPHWGTSSSSVNEYYLGYVSKTVNTVTGEIYGTANLLGVDWTTSGYIL